MSPDNIKKAETRRLIFSAGNNHSDREKIIETSLGITVYLYESNNIYETETITAYIRVDGSCYFKEITSEKAPGGMYGMTHRLDADNFSKLLSVISDGSCTDAEKLFRVFAGSDAIRKLGDCCKNYQIEYSTYVI